MADETLALTSAPAQSSDRRKPVRVPVWDRFVRLFHWSLAATIVVATATGFFAAAPRIDIHIWVGAAALGLVVARVIWGFLGPTHARFSDFATDRRTIFAHLSQIAAGKAERHRGHNPLGGAMVLALLGLIVAVAVTGVVVLGGVFKSGPLAFATSFTTGWNVRVIHELFSVALVVLIALHVAGVVFESWRTHENLARAMVDGRKEARPKDHASGMKGARPVTAIAIAGSLLAALGSLAWVSSARLPLGVPTAALDPTYAEECGDCHNAYHPTLLPRASWSALTAGLDDHFGENASLGPETTQRIASYLMANAAEAFDTKPANFFRQIDPLKSFTITATPFWTQTHRNIPTAVFDRTAVGVRGNCEACHTDAAQGRFYPGAIDIPSEATP